MHQNIKFFVNSQRCSENIYFEKLSKYREETKTIIIKYDEMRGDIHLVPGYSPGKYEEKKTVFTQ